MKCLFLDYVKLLMIGHVILLMKFDQNVKKNWIQKQDDILVLGNITLCRPLSTMITQKLIYTCRWLGSHVDVNGFNSDGLLPH